jgi:hypothetical protein
MIMKNNNVEGMQRRGQSYWYQDGIWELGVGVLFMLYAAYYALVGSVDEQSTLFSILSIAYIGVIPGGMLLVSWAVKRVKVRISAPRTGYVTFGTSRPRRVNAIVISAVVAAGTIAGALLVKTLYVPVLVAGIGIAVGTGVTGVRLGVYRLSIAGAVGLVSSVFIGLVVDEPEPAFTYLFGITGAALAVTGLLALVRYLKKHPLPEAEEEEAP